MSPVSYQLLHPTMYAKKYKIRFPRQLVKRIDEDYFDQEAQWSVCLSWNEARVRAATFTDEWRDAAYEKGEGFMLFRDTRSTDHRRDGGEPSPPDVSQDLLYRYVPGM